MVFSVASNSVSHLGNLSRSSDRELSYVMSDSSGKWRCRLASGDLRKVVFRLFHPDYASVTLGCDTLEQRALAQTFVSESALKNDRAVVFLKPGLPLSGVVVDADGKPVEGAKIEGDDFTVWTPADGKFNRNNCREGLLSLLVQAEGYAPVSQSLQVNAGMNPVVIKLEKSPGLCIRVSDAKKHPIPGVEVSVNQWLGKSVEEWKWKTDTHGKVNWASAPTTNLDFSIEHPGYETIPSVSFIPDGKEHTVILRRKPHVSGQVVSAEDGRPVAEFRVIPGRLHVNHYDWDWRRATNGHAGVYNIPILTTNVVHALRVEAAGFYPVISSTFTNDAGDHRINFTLRRGKMISGEVRFPDGRAAKAAQVALCTETENVLLGAAKFLEQRPNQIHVADDQGRFSFSPDQGARTVVAVDKQGYGECSVAQFMKSKVLTLKPWGRVRGTVQIGHHTGTNELIQLVPLGSYRPLLLVNHFTALTDAAGRFQFDEVPPGEFLIGRLVDDQFSHGQPIQVHAGQTTTAQLGRTGRSVVVRVNAADGRTLDWGNTRQPAFLRKKLPSLVPPQTNDPVAEQLWLRNYWDSPAGRARQIASAPFVLQYQSNNVFTADNIPAGDYECEIHYHEFTGSDTDRCLGIVKQDVRIPLAGPASTNTPLDLGVLTIHLQPEKDR